MKLHGKEVEGIRVTEKKLKVWGELYFDTENFLLHILKKGDELKIYKYDLSKRVYITSKHREINNTVYRSIVDVYENNKLIKKEIINEIMVLKKNEFSIPNSNIKIFNSPLGKKMIEKCSKINK